MMKTGHPVFLRWPLVGAIMLLSLLTACNTIQVGTDFDLQAFESRVEHKVTTKAQVQAWLGAPNSKGFTVETDGTRHEKWIYYYGSGQVTGKKQAQLKYLEIRFSDTGQVAAYNWSN